MMLSSGMLPVPESERLQPADGYRTHRVIRSYHSDVPEWPQPTEGLVEWGPSIVDPNGNVFPKGETYPMQTLSGFDAFMPRRNRMALPLAPRGRASAPPPPAPRAGFRPRPVPRPRGRAFPRFQRLRPAPMMGFEGVRETWRGLPKLEMSVGAGLGYFLMSQNRVLGAIAGAALGGVFGVRIRKALTVGIAAAKASQQVEKVVEAATAAPKP